MISFSSESNKIIERLQNVHQISLKNIKVHFFHHYLDKLNWNEKLLLLKQIYTEDEKRLLWKRKTDIKYIENHEIDNNNNKIIISYFDPFIFLKSNILYIVLYHDIIYNVMNWSRNEEDIKIPKINKNKLNKSYIGFYDYDEKNNLVFKIKDRIDDRMSFFIVEKTGMKKLFSIWNELQDQLTRLQKDSPKIMRNDEESIIRNKLSKYQVIIIIEIIMRELSFIHSISTLLSLEEVKQM